MPKIQRQALIRQIEKIRRGRSLITFLNFDRESSPPMRGLITEFRSDTKEALFRTLKETLTPKAKIDLLLYTRGGDVNSVWPIVSLLREFDPDFEVLVPFRCHSGGTLLALGAKKIVMTPLGELSPIDPTTRNQFNPRSPTNPEEFLGISVEDVTAFKSFVKNQLEINGKKLTENDRSKIQECLKALSSQVHPLALGNVYRVLLQISKLAKNLLKLHAITGARADKIVKSLTSEFYSHLHMISRHEAQDIIGKEKVEFADDNLSQTLDGLLRAYEEDFGIRRKFILRGRLGDKPFDEYLFAGGAIESKEWSYLHYTRVFVRQNSIIPPNVKVQITPGQNLPILPGLAREYSIELLSEDWLHNTTPKGVTT